MLARDIWGYFYIGRKPDPESPEVTLRVKKCYEDFEYYSDTEVLPDELHSTTNLIEFNQSFYRKLDKILSASTNICPQNLEEDQRSVELEKLWTRL